MFTTIMHLLALTVWIKVLSGILKRYRQTFGVTGKRVVYRLIINHLIQMLLGWLQSIYLQRKETEQKH